MIVGGILETFAKGLAKDGNTVVRLHSSLFSTLQMDWADELLIILDQ